MKVGECFDPWAAKLTLKYSIIDTVDDPRT